MGPSVCDESSHYWTCYTCPSMLQTTCNMTINGAKIQKTEPLHYGTFRVTILKVVLVNND